MYQSIIYPIESLRVLYLLVLFSSLNFNLVAIFYDPTRLARPSADVGLLTRHAFRAIISICSLNIDRLSYRMLLSLSTVPLRRIPSFNLLSLVHLISVYVARGYLVRLFGMNICTQISICILTSTADFICGSINVYYISDPIVEWTKK